MGKNFEGFDCTKKVLVLVFSRTNFCVATRFYLPYMKFISVAKVSLEHGSYESFVTTEELVTVYK